MMNTTKLFILFSYSDKGIDFSIDCATRDVSTLFDSLDKHGLNIEGSIDADCTREVSLGLHRGRNYKLYIFNDFNDFNDYHWYNKLYALCSHSDDPIRLGCEIKDIFRCPKEAKQWLVAEQCKLFGMKPKECLEKMDCWDENNSYWDYYSAYWKCLEFWVK